MRWRSRRGLSGSAAWALSIAALVVHWALALLGRTIRLVGEGEAIRRLEVARRSGESCVFFHWSRDEIARLVLATRLGLNLGGQVSYVTDSTLGGRFGSLVLRRLGYATLTFRVSSTAMRIKDIREILRARGDISISADGRGPYETINPVLEQLIVHRRALAVPVAVVASPSVEIRRPWPLVIPMPGARIAVAVGRPVDLNGVFVVDAVSALREALEDARREAGEFLSRRGKR